VGLISELQFEGPVCSNGQINGWRYAFAADREFPTDMAGFAISTQLLMQKPDVKFNADSLRGHLESDLMRTLVRLDKFSFPEIVIIIFHFHQFDFVFIMGGFF
jgi:hypothetical protein